MRDDCILKFRSMTCKPSASDSPACVRVSMNDPSSEFRAYPGLHGSIEELLDTLSDSGEDLIQAVTITIAVN